MKTFRVPAGFKRFFVSKLKATGIYDNNQEIMSEVEFTIENMEYDMSNGDSLMAAFCKACRDIHVDPDKIECFV